MDKKITDSIIYIGVDDKDIDLFESQYVVPNGVSYNSYVIMDDKIAIMDTADARVTDKWFANLREALGDRKPDYLVVSHLEPDHASNIQKVAEAYPDMQIVGNAKTFNMMGQFFDIDLTDRKVVVVEGDKLSLGKHELTFVMAPMVHWPEVMMEYESTDKVLFSADGFGKFGALDTDEDWTRSAPLLQRLNVANILSRSRLSEHQRGKSILADCSEQKIGISNKSSKAIASFAANGLSFLIRTPHVSYSGTSR